jgi:hypothetical protein
MKQLMITGFLLMCLFGEYTYAQNGSWISGMPQKTYWWFGHHQDPELYQSNEPVSMHPPIFGKKRRNNGMILPLPFGEGLSFSIFDQPYKTDNLRMNSSKNIDIRMDTVSSNTTSGAYSITFRPDVWVFPFLNIYGLIGYENGKTKVDISAPYIILEDLPLIGDVRVDTTVSMHDEISYDGPVYGFGITGSTGFKGFFVLLNYEYTVTDEGQPELKRTYQHFQAKGGVLLGRNQHKAKGAFWLGTMFMHDNHQIKGEIATEDVFPGLETLLGETITYSADNTVKNPWNFIFGGSLNINDHHILTAEAGFQERKQLHISYTYRF